VKNMKITNLEQRKAELKSGHISAEQVRVNVRRALDSAERLRLFVESRPGRLFPEPKRA
jgi:hypothetical protein